MSAKRRVFVRCPNGCFEQYGGGTQEVNLVEVAPMVLAVPGTLKCSHCGLILFQVEDPPETVSEPTPEPRRRRLKECVKRWPDCETGLYDPRCCRFPKSCSCDITHGATEDMLEEL